MSGHIIAELLRAIIWVAMACAIWKGDTAVRVAAVAFLILDLATLIIHPKVGDVSGETVLLALDFFCSVIFLVLAVRYANLWLGTAMLFQAAQFSLHAYYLVMELPHDLLHAWINDADDWGILISLIVGMVLAMRHRATLAREAAERDALRQERAARAR